ncbi:ABC transporter substrate-binding protein [Thiorhodococcus fuscus]|uniref:ABC transporter substrate-binding protein n=1 Tax=Thiorhodococcus fuscus TaxID=527200 RepID=A0ABW4YE52_9GAMM
MSHTRPLGPMRWIRFAALALTLLAPSPPILADGTVRLAVLKFGTLSWEADVIRRNGFDRAEGFSLEPSVFAGPQATLVALMGGDADMAVTDWIWVSRQRDAGRPYSFVPYSTAIGALMVPSGSDIGSLADLAGHRIGVAGGPLDKNWLLLRALARQRSGLDLASQVDPVYGAPPLLNAQIQQDRLDAVITHWPYAARLSAVGYRPLMDAREAMSELGIQAEVPMIGYVFDEDWAKSHRETTDGFFRAVARAKSRLAESDAEWQALRPLMGVDDEATFIALRDGYRAGIPKRWGKAERAAAEHLFEILRATGGEALVGKAARLAPGTFWEGATD